MAGFATDELPFQSNNLLNYAREIPSDNSLGNLFKGVANTVGEYYQNKDIRDRRNLEKDANSMVRAVDDEALNRGGVSNETVQTNELIPPGNSSGAPTPSVLRRSEEVLKVNQEKYEAGLMSDTAYTARISKEAKAMRARYPNLSTEVDSVIQRVTGASTANDYRKELNQEVSQQAAAGSAEAKHRASVLSQNSTILSDPYEQSLYKQQTGRDFNASDFDTNAVLYATGTRKFEDADVAREKSKLALMDKKLETTGKFAKQSAIKEAINMRDRVLYTGVSKDEAGIFTKAQDMVSKAMSDSIMSPEEQAGITVELNKMELVLKQKTDELLTTVDKDGNSYAGFIQNRKDQDDVRAVIMEPFNSLKESVVGGKTDISLLNAVKLDTEARKNLQDNALLKDNGGILGNIKKVKEIQGSEVLNRTLLYLGNDPKLATPEQKAVANKIALRILSGESLTKIVQEASAAGTTLTPQELAEPVKGVISSMANPETPKEKASEWAKTYYPSIQKGEITDVSKSDPSAYFNMVFTPEITEKLKGTSGFEAYAKAALHASTDLMRPFAQTLTSTQSGTDNIEVKLDEKTKRFVVTDNKKGTDPISSAYNYFNVTSQSAEAAAKMNQYLDKLEPIMKEAGYSMEYILPGLMNTPDFNQTVKEGSAVSKMKKAVTNWYNSPSRLDDKPSKGNPISPAEAERRKKVNEQNGFSDQSSSAEDVISGFEGFIAKAAYDVNAFRTGYGSDTVTLPDGSIQRVTKDTVVSKEDAKRDLKRRAAIFSKEAQDDVGEPWDGLPEQAKAALTSVAYNYGSLPHKVVKAAQSGDLTRIADAVESLKGHNKGINAKRRIKEAALIRGA